jgi:hypothetical protein
MLCREETGVSFGVVDILEPKIARHWLPLVSISRHLAPFGELGWKVITLNQIIEACIEEGAPFPHRKPPRGENEKRNI